jgi:DnaJ domain
MAELARGSVTDRPWGRTLATIGLRSMSGQLTVYSDNREYAVVFSHGAVVGAFSPLPGDAVARVALTAGLLTANEVTEAGRRQSHDDGTDTVIEVGRLTPDQAARLRRRATAHRASRTFALERGEFVFTDTVTAGWHPDAAVDVRAVVYLGARQTLSEHRLASDLGLLGASFRLREDAVADLGQFGFTELERPILAALRQGASLHAVEIASAAIDQRTVRAAIYALACSGAADAIGELHGQEGVSSGPPVRPSAPAIPRTRTGSGTTAAPPLSRTRTGSDPAVSRTATPLAAAQPPREATSPPPVHAATARTVSSVAPRGVSGQIPTQPDPVLSRTTSPTTPTTARTTTSPNAARTTTSPNAGRTTTPPNAGRTTTPPNAARTTTPPNAARTTTPPPPRRTAAPASPTPTHGPRPVSTSPSQFYARSDVRVPTATGAPPTRNPLAVSELQSLIKAKSSLVDQGADHFLLLGIKPDAPIDVVRTAFYGLVRRIHPDSLLAAGLSVTDEAQRLMARLNECYATLNHPEKRREYEAMLHIGDGRQSAESLVTAVLSAEERFRRGVAALKRDAIDDAVREFESAVELKKDEGDYLALLTWARYCAAPDKEAAAPQARQMLERASRLSPESVTPRFWYGRLERTLGRAPQALNHFRWVLDQDPRHAEAAAEVRVLMARDSKSKR